MSTKLHSTAERLISTVSDLLDGSTPNEILVDVVLARSGVSRSSVYHHFEDFQGLIEATLLRRFSANVDADAKVMADVAENATSKEEYWDRIHKLSAATQIPERAPIRAERARIISLAASNKRFGENLAVQQDRLTDAIAFSIAQAQVKGWVKPELDSRTIAVFLQAYSLGRAVDDSSSKHVNNANWVALIDQFLTTLKS